jgi:hypothetical protein
MLPRFPKLLVATEFGPDSAGGGPAVVRQMLREWPSEQLLWWSCMRRAVTGHGLPVSKQIVFELPGKLRPQRRAPVLKATILEHIWSPLAARNLAAVIRREKPDVIWGIPHDWSIFPLGAALPKSRPSYHITVQDYFDIHGRPERLGRARCTRIAQIADFLYRSASTRDATSHPMAKDLAERTGAQATQILHAGLESRHFESLAGEPRGQSCIRIAHAGTILAEPSFVAFVSAVAKLRPQIERPIRLDLFGAHSYSSKPWFDASWMFEHGDLSQAMLEEELSDCTWGFAPMQLTDEDYRYNRFSFPTKFITYLAAGLPVIVTGHRLSSASQMVAKYGVGLALEGPTPELIRRQLLDVLSDANPRKSYRSEVVRCARSEFDAEKMRLLLTSSLRRSAAYTG